MGKNKEKSAKSIEREKKEMVKIMTELCTIRKGDEEYIMNCSTTLSQAQARMHTARFR